MPNRILREGILTSQRVNALSAQEELFYRRLMSVVDDYGRYFGAPMPLRAACYPLKLDTVSDKQIDAWLAALQERKLLVVYEVNGTRFLEMTDFRQQQRAKNSKYPSKDGAAEVQPGAVQEKNKNGVDLEPLPEWVPAELWASWWGMRAAKTRTQRAQDLALKELRRLESVGHSMTSVLENCIRGGYRGIFPPGGKPVKKRRDDIAAI